MQETTHCNKDSIMIKIRQTLILLISSGLLFFSSCLKDDPNSSNTTLFYGHQDIPNINYYMPQALLESLDTKDSLFFGENPPHFLFDSCYSKDTSIVFAFLNPTFGITGLSFKDNGSEENSSTDNTFDVLNKKWKEYCLNDTVLPIFFDTTFNGTTALDPDVLRHAYIMGNDPYFTLYFYEIRKEQHQYQPLNAIILSGIVDYTVFPIDTIHIDSIVDSIVYNKTPRYLLDVEWGMETMGYFPKDANTQVALDAELDAGTQPQPKTTLFRQLDTLFIQPSKNR